MARSRLNLLLLLVTAVSLAFGVYGFLFGGVLMTPSPAVPHAANTPPAQPDTAAGRAAADNGPAAGQRQAAGTAGPGGESQPAAAGHTPTTEPDAEPTEVEGTGVVIGEVLDVEWEPVANVEVTLISVYPGEWNTGTERVIRLHLTRGDPLVARPGEPRHVRRMLSDAEGNFRFESLPEAGDWMIAARSLEHGLVIDRAFHGPEGFTRLRFRHQGATRGVIRTADGEEIKQAWVRWTYISGHQINDAAGVPDFELFWAPGATGFMLSAEGYAATRFFDESYRGQEGVEVVLEPLPRLSGRVTDSAGRPVARAAVTATSDDSSDRSGRATTCEEGRYSIGLEPGHYTVSVVVRQRGDSPGATAALDFSAARELNFQLPYDAGASLIVHATRPNGRRAQINSVTFAYADGTELRGVPVRRDVPGGRAIVGEQQYENLPATRLRVTVTSDGLAPWSDEIVLSEGRNVLEVVMSAGFTVRGRVLDQSGAEIPRTLGVRMEHEGTQTTRGGWVNQGGNYEVVGVAPGTWSFEVLAGNQVLLRQSLKIDGDLNHDVVVVGYCLLRVTLEGAGNNIDVFLIDAKGNVTQHQDSKILALEGDYTIYATSYAPGGIASRPTRITLSTGVNTYHLEGTKPDALIVADMWSPAVMAVLRVGDVILNVGGVQVASEEEFYRALDRSETPEVEVLVRRGREEITVRLPRAGVAIRFSPVAR